MVGLPVFKLFVILFLLEEGVIAKHSQRNFQEKSFISYMTNYTLEDGRFKQVSFPYSLNNVKIISPSPSGNLMALIKSKKGDNNVLILNLLLFC